MTNPSTGAQNTAEEYSPAPLGFLAALDGKRRGHLGRIAGTLLGGGSVFAILALDGPLLLAANCLLLVLAAHLASFVWERRFNTGLALGVVFAFAVGLFTPLLAHALATLLGSPPPW